MISIDKYEKLLNSGLSLDHYFILTCLYNNIKLPDHKRVHGSLTLLEMKGYLQGRNLTVSALDLIQEDIQQTSVTETTTAAPESSGSIVPSVRQNSEFVGWVKELHAKCQAKLVELVGKKQVKGKIGNKEYPFMPGVQDLSKNLYKVIMAYKLTDVSLVEKCIMNYIEKCYKAHNWFPTLYYYIHKNNKSDLVTDYENYDYEEEAAPTQNFTGDTII